MKDLTLYINENLIKVPKSLLQCLFNHVLEEYVSYIYSKGYEKEAKEIIGNNKIEIIKNFKPQNKKIDLNYILDDLPEKIRNNWKFQIGQLKLIIDWEGKIWGERPTVNASFEESNEHGCIDCFTINPLKFIEEVNNGCNIDNIKDIIEKLKYSIWHESSHAVQHGALKWLNKNQIHKSRVIRDDPNSSKEDRRREYLTSNVEYDPTIKTKIFQFKKKYDINSKDILKYLAGYVGAINDNDIETDEFFNALKQSDTKKWKRAVKKFYMAFNFNVDDLLKDIKN